MGLLTVLGHVVWDLARRAHVALGLGQPRLGEPPIHGGVVYPELLGNGAHPSRWT
jgi:hypothetical protein